MAYIVNNSEKDNQEELNQTNQNGLSNNQVTQQVGKGGQPANIGNTSTERKPSASGQFTNIQTYVDRNKGAQPDIAGKVNQYGQTAQQDYQNIKTGVENTQRQNDISQDKEITENWLSNVGKVSAQNNPSNYNVNSGTNYTYNQADMDGAKKAQEQLNRQYQGYGDFNTAQADLAKDFTKNQQAYNDETTLSKSESGQRTLLDKYFGQGRTSGVKDLSFAMFNQDDAQRQALAQAQQQNKEYNDLISQYQTKANEDLQASRLGLQNYQSSLKQGIQSQGSRLDQSLADAVARFNQNEASRDASKTRMDANDVLRNFVEQRQNTAQNLLQSKDSRELLNRNLAVLGPNHPNSDNSRMADTFLDVANFSPETYAKFANYNRQNADTSNIDPEVLKLRNALASLVGESTLNPAEQQVKQGNYGFTKDGPNGFVNHTQTLANELENLSAPMDTYSYNNKSFFGLIGDSGKRTSSQWGTYSDMLNDLLNKYGVTNIQNTAVAPEKMRDGFNYGYSLK